MRVGLNGRDALDPPFLVAEKGDALFLACDAFQICLNSQFVFLMVAILCTPISDFTAFVCCDLFYGVHENLANRCDV